MKRIAIIGLIVALAIAGIVVLQHSTGAASLLWKISEGGRWLLPLVTVSSLLDSVHPCSFSILLITIAFLFGMQMARGRILQIGGTYIAGIFGAYLLIGLGLLNAFHLFNTPHFMGKLGATLLIGFGLLNLTNALFPKFPIKLKIPSVSHTPMAALMEKASLPAALGLGALVGICQFPCMGGPYLMVIGLLHDRATYFTGFGYLTLYNLILIAPLVAVLGIAADKTILDKMQVWKSTNLKSVRFWAGIAMIGVGILVSTSEPMSITALNMNKLLARIESLKDSAGADLSTAEDLSIAVMNLISLEEHFFFTGVKTEKNEYFDTALEVREVRKALLAKLMPNHEGETWCISKHLLASTMRLMEVGNKLQSEGQKDKAKSMFDNAYRIYSIFWALKLKLISGEKIKTVARSSSRLDDLVSQLANCCDE